MSEQCPYCLHHYILKEEENMRMSMVNLLRTKGLDYDAMIMQKICSNKDCKEMSLDAILASTNINNQRKVQVWPLLPRSNAKPQPSYIPEVIRNDYEEACLIAKLSPKASATLARRCLQGMIRDFFGVKKDRLVDEINAIKDRVDPEVWISIDAIRRVGNIGAHMEKDINLIIDVEPNEANLLLQLIEQLFAEWYVNRHYRQQRLKEITELAKAKDAAKNSQPEGLVTG